MIKAFIHTYVRGDGKRVPWKIADNPKELVGQHPDDRIEEVLIFTKEQLDSWRSSVDWLVHEAEEWCKRVATGDITWGETADANDLLEYLKGVVREL